ncbi:MAG: retroviral-like aspartic protease family protein [Bryobacteraceae bacterium]
MWRFDHLEQIAHGHWWMDPHMLCVRTVYLLSIILPAIGAGQPVDADLKSLYGARRWTELHEALKAHRGSALYRGVVAAVFNDDRRAEHLLQSVITSAPSSDEAYEAYEWLAHIYFRTGRYHHFIADMEARWEAFPNKSELKNEQSAIAGFRGLPDQVIGKFRPSILSHEPDKIFIPISINKSPATYFFDTGAWVNCMSESEAKRLGLAIHDTSGTLNTGTAVRVGFRTAVAPEVVVGGIHFNNVSFAVFRDDQEPWSDLPIGRRGLIGIPIILGLRSLRWSQDGVVEIGMKSASTGARRSNLFFDDDHLVIEAELGRRKILATLDTGAQTTDLYENFAEEFANLVSEAGKKDTTEVRGVGHAESFGSITVPELKLNVGHLDVVLRPAHVLLKQIGAKCCAGNFGMDLLRQGRAFKIDFGAMRLDLDPKY